VELIVSVDSSENIAIAAVHARVPLKDGGFSVQLLTAKSKIVCTSTIPRAELRAAVVGATLGHVARANLRDQHVNTIFVTDSTICLYWIGQDQRPLQC